ncbi:ATP-binding cassette domain-containing protein [Streptomyces sp. NPDC049813]|uniref:ATP-binding cassette domain-containing protein n=1 Tax=Streptomyces sp. NPDC049813 TaxID=3365597 RepID=UPI00378E8277
MIQAIGLTSNVRKGSPPAADDVSFDAPAGQVTALLGAPGAGKTTVVRLMLELQHGRGIAYFRGRPLHRLTHPVREVGVLLGDVPGHPGRSVRGHLRMLCAAAGVPGGRADEVLEAVGLVSLRDERLGTLSRGMDRRLGLACALLADPHTLVLDGPTDGLVARESRWMHGILRAHANLGGTVLFTTGDAKEAAWAADRVVTLVAGRTVADQAAADFARTRLRPRVAVRSPHASRLGVLLAREARNARRTVEVVPEGGNSLSVYGSTCADVGETAFRHNILVHQLADEIGDAGPVGARPVPRNGTAAAAPPRLAPGLQASGAAPTPTPIAAPTPTPTPSTFVPLVDTTARPTTVGNGAPSRPPAATRVTGPHAAAVSPLPPPIRVRPARGPLRPVRYELQRATGIATGHLTAALVLAVSALLSVLLARTGHTPQPRLLAAWPRELPLPPAALGAGLLGAFAFGDEFRHPALATDRGTVPRRLGLLAAKLLVSAATAVLLALLVVGCDVALLSLVYGSEIAEVPADWPVQSASWVTLVVACAWAGVLASGVFRSTAAGLAAVVAVPVVIVPLVQKALVGPSVRTAAGLPTRLRDVALVHWPFGAERFFAAGVRMIAQPVGGAMTLSITALLCAYLLMVLRPRVR